MYQKNCDRCIRPSFSSSEIGEWLCPICGNNLTAYPFFDAMTMERIHMIALPVKKKLNSYQQTAN
ncbi:hypothetical protein [Bacillus sp. S/N-304-OC-R1]|uniref:hypothetical protein n=1 Tax=Bacillus sp. S/N-304-OC-R1 TaxID=2758034 RepID=UPI001C8E5583|nr:hypothetical protein [Bacillus sp. S/N-304-OC-R1]MBY0122944.1 hypothetical protein [Bacillus sp. S/N-304-OC-R1]